MAPKRKRDEGMDPLRPAPPVPASAKRKPARRIVRRPQEMRPAPTIPDYGDVNQMARDAAYALGEHGVVHAPMAILAGKDTPSGSLANPLSFAEYVIRSDNLKKYVIANGFCMDPSSPEHGGDLPTLPVVLKLIEATMTPRGNPVVEPGLAGAWGVVSTTKAIADRGVMARTQILAESGLHGCLDAELDRVLEDCVTIYTMESGLCGITMQQDNLHSDCCAWRVALYDFIWRRYARWTMRAHEPSLVPAGNWQITVNLGEPLDPETMNHFAVLDHRAMIPHEPGSEEEHPLSDRLSKHSGSGASGAKPPAVGKGIKASHWRKLSSFTEERGIEHFVNHATFHYMPGGCGDGIIWVAMRPGDNDQPSGLGIHAGLAPRNGKKPSKPRVGCVIGGQTLPKVAFLEDDFFNESGLSVVPNLLDRVVEVVRQIAEGCGGCHTFLARSSRPPGYADWRQEGPFKNPDSADFVPDIIRAKVRLLRCADATMPGADHGFRHERPCSFGSFRDMYRHSVRHYIEHGTFDRDDLPQTVKNALAFCIRTV